MDDGTADVLYFGTFELDLRTRELRRKGVKIRVQEQPLQLLAMLLEHPGELLTREELRRKLWPDDTFVDFDHGLNTAVNRLRTALGDSADKPRFIETLPRKGYRFVGQVSASGRPGLPAAKAKSDKIRLAVLPLNDYSDGSRDEYFSDGLTEELITQLGGLNPSRLGVIARTSMSRYKNTQKSIREIGHELDVDYVLEGSVRRVGERVRISAQLIDARDETHVWAQPFERDMRDVLLLQDEVSRLVAGSIRITLAPQEQERFASLRRVDPEAYDACLQGRFYWRKLCGYGWKQACSHFERAIAKDPGYAAAYSGLADCYLKEGQFFIRPPKEAFERAREAASRAIAIDPTLAEAHGSLAMVLFLYDWDWTGAEREFRSALMLGAQIGILHSWYSWFLLAMGKNEESLREAQLALVLEPSGNITNTIMGWYCLVHDDYSLADMYCRKAIEMEPDSFLPHLLLGMARIAESRIEEAIALINRSTQLLKTDYSTGILAAAYARSGQQEKIVRLREDLTKKSEGTFVGAGVFAMLAMTMGDLSQTFEWLDKAYDEHNSSLVMLNCNPAFRPIRSDPRFQAILRRMNFPLSGTFSSSHQS
jgi:TolB-like protein/tetratricopeptide (TPR) repeat protein